VITLGHDVLAEHHLQPASLGEQLLVFAHDLAAGAEQRDLARCALGQLQLRAVAPEWRVIALGRLVVQHQKIAHAFVFVAGLAVELIAQRHVAMPIRKHDQQTIDAGLDQMDCGRFQRLDEAAGQPERDAIAMPDLVADAAGEAQCAWLGQRLAIEVGEQQRAGLVFAHEVAAIDMAIAGAVLQRDAPLPAGRPGIGLRVRAHRLGPDTGHGDGTIARQPTAPVVETRLQRTFDQQPAKARAIQEQVAFDALAAVHLHRFDEAVGGAQLHVHHLAFAAAHAALLGIAAQEPTIKPGIEMIGIADTANRGIAHLVHAAKSPAFGGNGIERIVPQTAVAAGALAAQPVVVKRQRPERHPCFAEGMQVRIADTAPIVELDAELECALRRAQHFVFIQTEKRIDQPDLWDGGLADTDDADLLGLDQADTQLLAHGLGEACRGHPAGGTATDDDDVANS